MYRASSLFLLCTSCAKNWRPGLKARQRGLTDVIKIHEMLPIRFGSLFQLLINYADMVIQVHVWLCCVIDKDTVTTLLPQNSSCRTTCTLAVTGGYWLTVLVVFVMSESDSCPLASGDLCVAMMTIVVSLELDCS